MDNQKILWIVFSITLFLLVVVVVGFIWFLPPEDGEANTAIAGAGVVAESVGDRFDPIEWARGTTAVPGISETAESGSEEGENLLLVIGAAEQATPSGTTAPSGQQQKISGETSPGPTTIRLAPSSAPPKPASTPAVAQPTAARPVRSQPAAKPRSVRVTQYWIQAGSFESRTRAEQTQQVLRDRGFNGRITSVDVSGSRYYRVRIGPYDSKAEAEKFLAWIKEIDSFDSSYISEVYTTRTVN